MDSNNNSKSTESLKSNLLAKLQKTSHLENVFETMPCNGYDLSADAAQNQLIHAELIKKTLHETLGKGETWPFLQTSKRLTRMNDLTNIAQWKVHEIARKYLFFSRDLEYHTLRQLTPDVLFDRLYRNSTPWLSPNLPQGVYGSDHIISYEGFQKVIQELGHFSLVHLWLTPKLFMRLAEKETQAHVSIYKLIDYVGKKLDNHLLRLELFIFDDNGKGYITKENLMLYLEQKLDLENQFWKAPNGKQYPLNKYYIESLGSEIFFLLDPQRTKKIRAVELIDSRLLTNIKQNYSERPMFAKFMRKMSTFITMDDCGDECIPVATFCEKFPDLSQDIWGKDGERWFLDSFLDRLVQLYGDSAVDQGKISFETYLDITFACENLASSFSSICYFFRVLDIDNKGYLNQMDLQFHYRNIQAYLEKKMGISLKHHEQHRLANFKNIQSQISDMLAGGQGLKHITPAKLYKIREGHMLIEFLTDAAQSLEKQDEYYQQANTDSSPPLNHNHSSLTPNHGSVTQNNVMYQSTLPSSITPKNEEGQGDVLKQFDLTDVDHS